MLEQNLSRPKAAFRCKTEYIMSRDRTSLSCKCWNVLVNPVVIPYSINVSKINLRK